MDTVMSSTKSKRDRQGWMRRTGVRQQCRMVSVVLAAVLWLFISPVSAAAEYPTRNISLIVAFAAGGSADNLARFIARQLSSRLSTPVIVENRPGAGGRIASQIAAKAAPDGHTLFVGSYSTMILEPLLRTNLGYDPVRDFAPISLVSEEPFFLVVSNGVPAKSVADLIAHARKAKSPLSYASWGPGTIGHLLGELFRNSAKLDLTHVPYKGAAPALTDVVAGHVSMMFVPPLTAMGQIRSAQVRPLAVTGSSRHPNLPDVPTLAELGMSGYDLLLWYGLLAPSKTPTEIVSRLNKEVVAIVGSEEFRRYVKEQGAKVIPGSPKEFSARIAQDTARAAAIIKATQFHGDE